MLPSRACMRARDGRDAAMPPSHSERPASAVWPTATGYCRFPANIVSSNDSHSSADFGRLNVPLIATSISASEHTPLRPMTSRAIPRRTWRGQAKETRGCVEDPVFFQVRTCMSQGSQWTFISSILAGEHGPHLPDDQTSRL